MEERTLNHNLKFAILKKFGCQADFAKVVGVSETDLSRIVRERRDPSPALKDKIASKLGTNPRDLFPED